ncbi:MAG: hypothetical protein IKQ18_05310 [Clostridia bacterium]|nr:hypothetical protein [Clostridia bacterium]
MKDNKIESKNPTENNSTKESKRKKFVIAAIIAVLCVSLITGIAYALFTLSFESSVNKISTTTNLVTVKVDNSLSGSFSTDLKNTALFDDLYLDPGQTSDVKFIKIKNNSSKTVRISDISLSITNLETDNWKIFSQLVNSDSFENFTVSSKDIENDLKLDGNNTTIAAGKEAIIAVAVMLKNESTSSVDSVSFKIQVTITEVQ